jgi:D-alanine-D-alanine ligase
MPPATRSQHLVELGHRTRAIGPRNADGGDKAVPNRATGARVGSVATERTTVLLLFGGRSSEHGISCTSAGNVLRALDRSSYDVIPVGIARDGRWLRQPDDPEVLRIVDGRLPAVAETGRLVLAPQWQGAPFLESGPDGNWQAMERVDVVFPLLHGPWGEDGTLQGLLETAGVPYVGSGVLASAAGMDKAYTKLILAAAGLPVGNWVSFHSREWAAEPAIITAQVAELGLPVFVKPCRAGSSVGVSKVDVLGDLAEAVESALREDPRLIVEAGVMGAREIECGVLVDPVAGPQVSSFGEIRVREGHDFYTFEAKYLDDSVDLIVPAELEAGLLHLLRQMAVDGFTALGCEGLARVDFFVTAQGEPIINEINTMPGFTAVSMYPRMWGDAGVSYPDLISALIADALRRGTGLR